MIQVKTLVKKYGKFTAVDGISFDVAKGEVFAFLGPDGAGNTNDGPVNMAIVAIIAVALFAAGVVLMKWKED